MSPPRSRNPKIPTQINDIVMKAVAPDVDARYQRASELLTDLLAARGRTTPRTTRAPSRLGTARRGVVAGRRPGHPEPPPRPRDSKPRFCWHCRKPLHARSARCPFCGEAQ